MNAQEVRDRIGTLLATLGGPDNGAKELPIKIETSVYQEIRRLWFRWNIRTFSRKNTHTPTKVFYDQKENCLVIKGE